MKFFYKFLVSGSFRKPFLFSLLIAVVGWTIIKISTPMLEDFLIVAKPLSHADALVVMAGSMSERLPVAVRLFREGIAPKILLTNDGILSAWSDEQQRNLYGVEWAESELLAMQIPRKAIVKLAYSSSGSLYDALNSRKEIVDEGIRSIIIVTSDYHSRRSLWVFEKVLRGHPVTVGVYPAQSAVSRSSDFIKFLELSREMIKYLFYRCRYSSIS